MNKWWPHVSIHSCRKLILVYQLPMMQKNILIPTTMTPDFEYQHRIIAQAFLLCGSVCVFHSFFAALASLSLVCLCVSNIITSALIPSDSISSRSWFLNSQHWWFWPSKTVIANTDRLLVHHSFCLKLTHFVCSDHHAAVTILTSSNKMK